MIWLGLLLFLLKLEARRQITYKLAQYQPFVSHLSALVGVTLSTCPHDDTVADTLQQLSYDDLDDKVRGNMVHTLVRKKVLEHSRLCGEYYTIAIDATGMHYYATRHCEHCLTKKNSKTGEMLYYHNVLEAKLVTCEGLAFSIATEFIENPDDFESTVSAEKCKQDCELKAFKRLAPKLKAKFPRLRICLLLDSLYAAQCVMDICKSLHWKVIINFKEGSIPTIYQDHCRLHPEQEDNLLRWVTPTNARQTITWTNGLQYHNHTLAFIQCRETTKADTPDEKTKTFVFITTFRIAQDRARAVVNEGGRQRWNVEDGFNTQKNRGYELEHVYCHDRNASKVLYLCLQIAHIINQLFENGSLIAALRKRLGGIKNLTADLLMHMLMQPLDNLLLERLFIKPFQIRLDSS